MIESAPVLARPQIMRPHRHHDVAGRPTMSLPLAGILSAMATAIVMSVVSLILLVAHLIALLQSGAR